MKKLVTAFAVLSLLAACAETPPAPAAKVEPEKKCNCPHKHHSAKKAASKKAAEKKGHEEKHH